MEASSESDQFTLCFGFDEAWSFAARTALPTKTAVPGATRPHSRATDTAVRILSPVHITWRTRASCSSATTPAVAALRRFSITTKPRKQSARSRCARCEADKEAGAESAAAAAPKEEWCGRAPDDEATAAGATASGLNATASTRNPCAAYSVSFASKSCGSDEAWHRA